VINTHKIKSLNGEIPKDYVPPLIGNGSLSMIIDHTGAQSVRRYFDYGGEFGQLIPMIWWAGRRYDDPLWKLIPFGHFEVFAKVNNRDLRDLPRTYWEQELDVEGGIVNTTSIHCNEIRDFTTTFIPSQLNMVVIHKRVWPRRSDRKIKLVLRYILHDIDDEERLPHRMIVDPRQDDKLGALKIRYNVDGAKHYEGIISLFSDVETLMNVLGNNAFELQAYTTEAAFYIIFIDNYSSNGVKKIDEKEVDKLIQSIKKRRISDTVAEHKKDWENFWCRSYISLPDKDLANIWRTALYHIRCSTTEWSIPPGILNTHWWGKYFHDEIFPYLALVSSNHVELAERVPLFRLRTLSKALKMTGGKGARYPYESTEDGDEGSPPGPTLYEIHQMATIALECWIHYLYTQNLDLLRKIYPVIRECAEYFRLWHVYEINDKAFIGVCTDLDESIYPVREPLYTTCGAIRTFLSAAEASRILGLDEQLRSIWEKLAKKLLENLPFDGEKYIPFKGASHQSLGALGVVFPYEVLDPGDERARRTVFDYMRRCRSTIGWRPTSRMESDAFFIGEGEGWIWNTAWLATCLARMDEGELAYEVMREIVKMVDTFGSINEAKTKDKTVHHWFVTGAGAYVYALNQMLIQSTPDRIVLFPAIPSAWEELSFKLRCQGNVTVEAKIANNKLHFIKIESYFEPKRINQKNIAVPSIYISENYNVSGGVFKLLAIEKGIALFQASFRRSLTVKFK